MSTCGKIISRGTDLRKCYFQSCCNLKLELLKAVFKRLTWQSHMALNFSHFLSRFLGNDTYAKYLQTTVLHYSFIKGPFKKKLDIRGQKAM